jgi:hypothetical protein
MGMKDADAVPRSPDYHGAMYQSLNEEDSVEDKRIFFSTVYSYQGLLMDI